MNDFIDIAIEQGWDLQTRYDLLWEFVETLDSAFNGTVSEALAGFAWNK